jgi:hypothetical protein
MAQRTETLLPFHSYLPEGYMLQVIDELQGDVNATIKEMLADCLSPSEYLRYRSRRDFGDLFKKL